MIKSKAGGSEEQSGCLSSKEEAKCERNTTAGSHAGE
jgi:hypothetical protein